MNISNVCEPGLSFIVPDLMLRLAGYEWLAATRTKNISSTYIIWRTCIWFEHGEL